MEVPQLVNLLVVSVASGQSTYQLSWRIAWPVSAQSHGAFCGANAQSFINVGGLQQNKHCDVESLLSYDAPVRLAGRRWTQLTTTGSFVECDCFPVATCPFHAHVLE